MKSKDVLIELTESQRDPYLARPEDFEVMRPDEAAQLETPGHGQHGENSKELTRLLREGYVHRTSQGQDLAGVGNVDHAGPPHTPGF